MKGRNLSLPRLSLAGMIGLLAYSTTGFAYAIDGYELRYGAADFQSPGAVVALHKKIRRKARDYCPSYRQSRDLGGIKACIDDVVDDLVSKIDNPLLDAYMRGEGELNIVFAEQQRQRDKG